MSSPPTNQVTFTANLQPAPACYPPDVNGMLQLIAGGGLAGSVPANAGGGIFVSSIPPSSSLTNKVWFKIDAAGRPLGIYMYYNGHWRKVYTGVAYGEIRMFNGNANVFDGTGLGVVGGDVDGWALCNGNNGTPDMRQNFFPVSGGWDGTSEWQAWDPPSGTYRSSGGQGQLGHRIAASDLPALATEAWVFNLRPQYSAGSPGLLVGVHDQSGASLVDHWPVTDTSNNRLGQNNVLPLPNYFAFAFMMFIGYA